MGIISEFQEFLEEYKAMGLAIGFMIGAALTTLIQSLVNDIIMPLLAPIMAATDWKSASLTIGPFVLKWGSFLSALINFILIAIVVFLIAKFILKEKKVEKK
jgi:large conductance mechanosensitive channel